MSERSLPPEGPPSELVWMEMWWTDRVGGYDVEWDEATGDAWVDKMTRVWYLWRRRVRRDPDPEGWDDHLDRVLDLVGW